MLVSQCTWNKALYSLYSTVTQNHSRWVLLRHLTQMLVSFALGEANFSRHITQNPPSGIKVALDPKRKLLALAMYISFLCVDFIHVG